MLEPRNVVTVEPGVYLEGEGGIRIEDLVVVTDDGCEILTRFSFVRTNAPPLPGLTCWNSTTLKIVPSTSMWMPFLNWLVEITG